MKLQTKFGELHIVPSDGNTVNLRCSDPGERLSVNGMTIRCSLTFHRKQNKWEHVFQYNYFSRSDSTKDVTFEQKQRISNVIEQAFNEFARDHSGELEHALAREAHKRMTEQKERWENRKRELMQGIKEAEREIQAAEQELQRLNQQLNVALP